MAFLTRRDFLKGMAIGAMGISPIVRADEVPSFEQRTFTYKRVGDLEIKAQVFQPPVERPNPVIMWIHGGALIMGSRASVSRPVRDSFLKAGYTIVSIDYRLAPETKAPQILEDVADAYEWLRTQGPGLFGVDTSKIAVLGSSAGGYLTLTCGYRLQPRPVALVSFWGYGDLPGPWYSEPSEFYRRLPLVAKEDAYAGVGGKPVADGNQNRNGRRDFYLYCRQNGLWPKEVVGFDPHTEDAKFDAVCPVRNVTSEYSPTLLIHGTEDTDVPYGQSVLMAGQFKKHGVDHQFITVPDAGHGLSRGDRGLVNAAYREAFTFVDKRMRLEGR